MPATVLNVVQLGVEATPGTEVAASKRLQSLNIEPKISAKTTLFTPMGGKFPVAMAETQEFTEADVSGMATYSELIYPLASCFSYAAPVQINPPTGTAYRWTFTIGQNTQDTVKTYTIEHGSAERARKFAYGLFKEFGYTVSRKGDGVEISGSMVGRLLQDGITLTSNPTTIELVPIVPTQFDLYIDSTSGALGTTQMLRTFSIEYSLADRYGEVWTINSANQSFLTHVERSPKSELKLKMETDAQGMAYLANLRNGGKIFIRIKATGDTIEGTTTYSFQHDICGFVSGGGNLSDEDGVYIVEWPVTVGYDSTWGKSQEIQIVNKQSVL